MAIQASVPFIFLSVGKIDKKEMLAVMFPDSTGNVYLLPDIQLDWQRKASREKAFKTQKIEPVVCLEVNDHGLLSPYKLSMGAGVNKCVDKAIDLISGKYDVAYLLDHGFLNDDQGSALVAGSLIGKERNAKAAVKAAKIMLDTVRMNQEELRLQAIGLTYESAQKALGGYVSETEMADPSSLSPDTTVTVEVNAEAVTLNAVTTEPRNKSKK